MWLFTKWGFFSVVMDRSTADMLLVRARDRRHLENLIDHFKCEAAIVQTPDADYGFRMSVPRYYWEWIVVQMTNDITYGNFKDEVETCERYVGAAFVKACHDVWEVMWKAQPRRWVGRGRR